MAVDFLGLRSRRDMFSAMRNLLIAFVVFFGCFVVSASAQNKRGPSTEEERTHALAAIDDLEANPLGENAKEERRWLTVWLIEVPDIHVGFCLELLPELPKGSKQDSDIIGIQLMYSGARYAIQHLGSSADSIDQYQAGVNGALKVYDALLAIRPKDRQAKLDDLLQRRTSGTLPEYVKERASAVCKR
jgi:hypothetical protein